MYFSLVDLKIGNSNLFQANGLQISAHAKLFFDIQNSIFRYIMLFANIFLLFANILLLSAHAFLIFQSVILFLKIIFSIYKT